MWTLIGLITFGLGLGPGLSVGFGYTPTAFKCYSSNGPGLPGPWDTQAFPEMCAVAGGKMVHIDSEENRRKAKNKAINSKGPKRVGTAAEKDDKDACCVTGDDQELAYQMLCVEKIFELGDGNWQRGLPASMGTCR